MEKTSKKRQYNLFHKNTTSQVRIIDKKNYTYRFLVEILNKYRYVGKKILDVGCGSGTIDFYLAAHGGNVLGIDISDKAIEKCNESRKILGLENRVFFKVLNFPTQLLNYKFDIIICSEVLEHLEKDLLAIKQMRRMLKQNGIVIISAPSVNAPLYRWGFAKKFDERVGHLRRYSINELSSMVKKSGFSILEERKVEGLFRNWLFLNKGAGKMIKFLRFYLSDIATIIDKPLIPIFGESNIIIIAMNKK